MIPRTPRFKGQSFASDSRAAPELGSVVICRRTRGRFSVVHVGRLVWLKSDLEGMRFETLSGFGRRYQRKQLSLAFS